MRKHFFVKKSKPVLKLKKLVALLMRKNGQE